MFRRRFILVFMLLAAMLLSACAGESGENPITKKEDLAGRKAGSINGSSFKELADPVVPGIDFLYYNDISAQIEAIKGGKVDALVIDKPVAMSIVATTPGLMLLDDPIAPDAYGFAFVKGDPLRDKVAEVIARFEQDGTMEQVNERWFAEGMETTTVPELNYKQDFDGSAGVLTYACALDTMPMSFAGAGGVPQGLDIELAMRIAYELNMKYESFVVDNAGRMTAVQSGKANMSGGCMSITEERKKNVDFAQYYIGGVYAVIRVEGYEAEQGSFFEELKKNFIGTFIAEDRYLLILSGLQVTLLVSAFSILFGTVLGFGICMMRRSASTLLSTLARIYISVMQGTPILVVLMILFYVVFGRVSIDGIIVSILAFAMNLAAYAAEMMRTGIDAVDAGQAEAASALGFNKYQVFRKVVAPQAVRHALPVYSGEVISTVKMTSVVGYIAVQDLTRVGDLIRSRTFDAFFSLIVTAIIYFLISFALVRLLRMAERKLDPRTRVRSVKGVAQ